MAGKESSSVKPVLSLKLLVDKKKNKVVLAESGKDFVDVLFSFLALPMGTIVRLLEKYQTDQNTQGTTIGCFNKLYKSVFDLGMENFSTGACKELLLHPRTVMEKLLERLKLNIDDTEVLKYYMCKSCCSTAVYSNFSSALCRYGKLMEEEEFQSLEGTDGYSEIFVSDKTLFTITDKMEVAFASIGLTLKTLKDLGYTSADHLHEMFVDVDHDKVLGLLKGLFSSDSPLTDVFLGQRSTFVIIKPIPTLQEEIAASKELISVTVFTRKLDKKVIYVESGKDFVDLLFTFLVLPLKFAWEISESNMIPGCVTNLCDSFKRLNSNERRSKTTEKCMLPWFYSCQQPLLDVYYANRERIRIPGFSFDSFRELKDPRNNTCDHSWTIYSGTIYSGFMKRGTTFMVSDDLNIKPLEISSSISSLKKWNIGLDDIEEQEVKISKTEATRLLRATLMTSTPLNTVLVAFSQRNRKKRNTKASIYP